MDNEFNKKLSQQARKRRAMYYRMHLKGITCSDLARRYKITRQRMSALLIQAAKDVNNRSEHEN
jgi:hypothetical protein